MAWSYFRGASIEEPPDELLVYRFLRAFPGYTASAMRDEDAETVAVMLALYQMEVVAQAEQLQKD